MRIKLNKLKIENFKGCRERSIDFGNTTDIFGANASGKTTIMDAFMWLLFDKDSTGATKFNIRPLDEDGKTIDNVEILVEAVLDIDGTELTLQKVQKQNWVKKRGTDTVALQGNVNTYEIDSFPASEKEFKEKIANIIPEDLFKLLSDPRAFAVLPWKKQREILMKFISEITDADVLAADVDTYAPIADEVQAAGVEKAIEKAKKAMAKLKDRQKELPARIDEASKSLVQIPELADLELQRNALNEQLEETKKQRDDMSEAYKAVEDIRGEILQIKLDMSGIAQTADNKLRQEQREARAAYDAANDESDRLYRARKQKETKLDSMKAELEEKGAKLLEVKQEYTEVCAWAMSAEDTLCPRCGQEMPADKLPEIRAGFESRKKARLDKIAVTGNALAAEIKELKAQIPEAESELAELKAAWTAKAGESSKAYEYMNGLLTEVDLSTNQEYQALQGKLSALELQLGNMDTGESVKQQLSIRERGIQEELDAVNEQFGMMKVNERTQEKIEILKAEQKEIGQQVADQEKKIFLLEQFSRAKMEMLSSKINGQFQMVNFKLFEKQINGGMKDTCEMTVDGVPYSSLNSAAKMQAGLDVICALSGLYGVSVPVWLDNRESVSEIPVVDGQIINLFVSPADKELRVEVA
ncbi:MAG: AAA family ATPase [Eubacteriales bacterium]|nr:AAA family ATPase [Eubacteriales bacterium]